MGKTKDIRAAVEDELSFDPLVDSSGIRVESLGGDVALNGTVPSYPQYLEAAAAARRIAGVTGVHNHLEVVLPPVDDRDDAALTTTANDAPDLISSDADPVDVTIAVQGALDRNALIPDDSDVVAETDENSVTLTGHVRTWAEHDAVLDAAWMTPGVCDVDDELVVTG
jgi:osmotically-inducible protein OsmY